MKNWVWGRTQRKFLESTNETEVLVESVLSYIFDHDDFSDACLIDIGPGDCSKTHQLITALTSQNFLNRVILIEPDQYWAKDLQRLSTQWCSKIQIQHRWNRLEDLQSEVLDLGGVAKVIIGAFHILYDASTVHAFLSFLRSVSAPGLAFVALESHQSWLARARAALANAQFDVPIGAGASFISLSKQVGLRFESKMIIEKHLDLPSNVRDSWLLPFLLGINETEWASFPKIKRDSALQAIQELLQEGSCVPCPDHLFIGRTS